MNKCFFNGLLGAFLDLADVFFLSSRLDPFPNVVLDALAVGKCVVCFENATGAAELFTSGRAHGAAVEYCDTKAAADAIVEILRIGKERYAETNRKLIRTSFRFSDYGAFLKEEIEAATGLRLKLEQTCDRLISSGAFDAEFHEGEAVGPLAASRACREYVARSSKGLAKFNPRPGFSDGYYRVQHDLQGDEVALDHALRTTGEGGELISTHRCVILDRDIPHRMFSGRTALHLHLHYADLAAEFVDRLRRLKQPIDVFVTTSSRSRLEVEYHFLKYEYGQVRVIEVANQGRDIGPFLTQLEMPLSAGNYDVVGHLHGKRSLSVDQKMGDRWRTYLLDTLLGDSFSQVLKLFAEDEGLGLVFAEDRHAVGWGANGEMALELARKLGLSVSVPAFPPPFPLGTMFWARPAAVAPLWRLGLGTDDLPEEPLAYDGTILHAIERMLPTICEAGGLSWCTVYDRENSW